MYKPTLDNTLISFFLFIYNLLTAQLPSLIVGNQTNKFISKKCTAAKQNQNIVGETNATLRR